MLRMEVQIFSPESIFTPESLEFLKDYDFGKEGNPNAFKSLYDVVKEGIEYPNTIRIEIWPWSFKECEDLNPEELFSAIVNHFKLDGLKIWVFGDTDKIDNAYFNIPEEYGTPFYYYEFTKDNFDEEDIENGTVSIGLDGDYAYVYDYENDEDISVNDIDGADWVSLY